LCAITARLGFEPLVDLDLISAREAIGLRSHPTTASARRAARRVIPALRAAAVCEAMQ